MVEVLKGQKENTVRQFNLKKLALLTDKDFFHVFMDSSKKLKTLNQAYFSPIFEQDQQVNLPDS